MKGHIPQTTSLYRFAPPPSSEMGKTDCAWKNALEGNKKILRRWQLPKSRAIYSIGLPTGGTRPLARLRAFTTFPPFRHTAPLSLLPRRLSLHERGVRVCESGRAACPLLLVGVWRRHDLAAAAAAAAAAALDKWRRVVVVSAAGNGVRGRRQNGGEGVKGKKRGKGEEGSMCPKLITRLFSLLPFAVRL